jgi:outer membrane protein TolC
VKIADALRALQADADALKASADADRASQATLEFARRQYTLLRVAKFFAGRKVP